MVKVHLNFPKIDTESPQIQNTAIEVWNEFVKKCVENMNSQDIHIVENSVSLLLKFLNFYDGKTDEVEESSYPNNPIVTVSVEDQDENVRKEV
jgi:hypothetical protein